MKSFNDQLWKIRKAHSGNKTDLGTAFEKMVKVFLENDKQYKSRFKEVHMWQKWSKQNNINKHDDGIDLVGVERDGSLCAIQCKCLDDNDKIDKDVVNAVSGAAKVYKMQEKIIVFTCGATSTCERFAEEQKVQLLSAEMLRDRPLDWTDYPKIKQIPPKKLRKHQELAFADVINGLKRADRGKMIMACGTGKTFTSLRIAEKLVPKNGTILYLVPSITLIQQTMREWSENSKTDMYYMAACSDKGVSDESELGSTTDVESRVSTDPNELKKLIENVNGMTTVIFSTYHSIERVAKAVKGMTIDLIFCDEAHKTVGGAVKVGNSDKDTYYTFVHKDSNIKAKKRIYMTATPRVYTDAVKKSAEEKEITFYSMDDEKHFGKTLHQLSFADAVHKYETLVDYKVKI
ncbi:MAG: DEAD/DEAH box helicase family protein, partial [Alphaproteobacteria bacterium]|nr:DEAD/DEAH box helicase family protein [Alphaproteobacteria bacterium]